MILKSHYTLYIAHIKTKEYAYLLYHRYTYYKKRIMCLVETFIDSDDLMYSLIIGINNNYYYALRIELYLSASAHIRFVKDRITYDDYYMSYMLCYNKLLCIKHASNIRLKLKPSDAYIF